MKSAFCNFFTEKADKRKLRLFLCSLRAISGNCYRTSRCYRAIEVAERFAEGKAGEQGANRGTCRSDRSCCHAGFEMIASTINFNSPDYDPARVASNVDAASAARCSLELDVNASPLSIRVAASNTAWDSRAYQNPRIVDRGNPHRRARKAEPGAAQWKLLEDIFGKPSRGARPSSGCLTSKVITVAQAIYAERRFADMPILADALEEAGCTSADILDHCRSGGEHVRGCWVMDLVLNKQ